MRLSVLGNAGRYLAPLSGGSSYLVEEGDARILLDAGGGARDALARMDVDRLDAIVVSHFHFDHVLDLVTLRDLMDEETLLVVPAGERARLDALATAYAFEGPFSIPGRIVEAKGPIEAGGLTLRFAPTQHSAPSFATRLGGLVYASDGAPCERLRELAAGAELLLMHALLPTVEPTSAHARIHSTAETAGRLAAEARADRLLLSHRYHESPDAAMREAASRGFGRVELAREGDLLHL